MVSINEEKHIGGCEHHVQDELQIDGLQDPNVGCLHVEVLEVEAI